MAGGIFLKEKNMHPNTSLHRLSLALAMAAGLVVPMAAHAAAISSTSGAIRYDGHRFFGHGFTSQRLGPGDYLLTFSSDAFPVHAPVFTCSPWNVHTNEAICNVYNVDWQTSSPSTVEIVLYTRSDGSPEDNGFFFTEMTAN
jgi:hypothetical protein